MQQTIRPAKGPIHARVTLPGSKSMTHRALLLASLADGVSEVSGMHISRDVLVFVNALHQLGIVTQLDEKSRSCIIAGGNGKFPKKEATIWCKNIKSVAQFLLAACAATPGVFYFDGSKHLRQHSFSPLQDILVRQGAQFTPTTTSKLPFTIMGSDTLEGGEMKLDEMTGQLISALLMIAPFARSPFNFSVNDLANRPYVDMTCSMMAEYGVLVHRIHQSQFMVPVPQRYQAKDYTIEPDLSLATYFFAAAAITGGDVTIQSIKIAQSKQTDAKFLAILEKMGCQIQESSSGLTLRGTHDLRGIEVSLAHFSDLFLALIAIAPYAKSPVRIAHLGSMKTKERDRFLAIKTELSKLGVHHETGDSWIKIFPSTLSGGLVSSHHDPRITMALSVMGLKTPGIIIDDAECINKTFPEFFNLWEKLTERTNISA